MRWYIFAGTLHTGEWYVLAESADHAWATDMALTWSPSWSFPKRKPTGNLREPLRRWRERDNGSLHADMAMGDACDPGESEAET